MDGIRSGNYFGRSEDFAYLMWDWSSCFWQAVEIIGKSQYLPFWP